MGASLSLAQTCLKIAQRSLALWFAKSKRKVPWRETRDPWAILLSEVLLQQTTVATGIRRFGPLLERFPTPMSMAISSESEVLKAWEGLGYYGRARRLWKCAKLIVNRWGGNLPQHPKDLQSLPGIGPYTAAAVASLAFQIPIAAVDGNITRVLARFYRYSHQVDTAKGKQELQALADRFLDTKRPGAHNESLMDLGATICKPKSPHCSSCPLSSWCLSFQDGDATKFPLLAPRKRPPHRDVALAFLLDKNDRILLVQRPPGTMLEGLWEIPGGKVKKGESLEEAAQRELKEETGIQARPVKPLGSVQHRYTHLSVTLHLFQMEFVSQEEERSRKIVWSDRETLSRLPIPTGTRKALALMEPRIPIC